MYIIGTQHFNRELNIPNVQEMNQTANSEINSFIDQYVPMVLLNALGAENFNTIDGLLVNGDLPDDAPQIWLNLVNGCTYTDSSGIVRNWKGLRYERGSFKGSLLADYVYAKWLEWTTSQLSGVGEVAIAAKNATAVNSTQRLVTIHNRFVEQYQGNMCGTGNIYFHQGVLVSDYFGGGNVEVSLIQFLTDKESDYPNSPKMRYELMNQLGL